jgi:hypothetical protein
MSDKTFSLLRTLEALARPEPGDLSSFLHETVYKATFGHEGGSDSREGYRGVAVRIPLALLARDLTLTGDAAGLLGAPKSGIASDALQGFSVTRDTGMRWIDWPLGGLPSLASIVAPIEFGVDVVGVAEEGFRAEGGAVRAADVEFAATDP